MSPIVTLVTGIFLGLFSTALFGVPPVERITPSGVITYSAGGSSWRVEVTEKKEDDGNFHYRIEIFDRTTRIHDQSLNASERKNFSLVPSDSGHLLSIQGESSPRITIDLRSGNVILQRGICEAPFQLHTADVW